MSVWRSIATSPLFVFALTSYAQSCQCPTPPGGSHVCEDDQYAICKIKAGECVAYCRSSVVGVGRLPSEFNAASGLLLAILEDPVTLEFRPVVPDSWTMALLRQLDSVLADTQPPGGYVVTLDSGLRQAVQARTGSDPGGEVRVGISPEVLPTTRRSVDALTSAMLPTGIAR